MYLFTKNDGPLKTTHDLFTQAEFFAEQANKMLKSVKTFMMEVPGSPEKNNLQQIIEVIPGYCQNLQVLVKQPSVGKQQTFEKVNHVITETKCLMNEIAKLVTICFICSTQFDIESRVIAGPHQEGDYSATSRETSVWRRRTPARTPMPGPVANSSRHHRFMMDDKEETKSL